MGTSGASETFFVVASTDLTRSGIMTTRIREQLEHVPDLKTKCTVTIAAVPLELPSNRGEGRERQVQTVADCVTQTILTALDRKHSFATKASRSN